MATQETLMQIRRNIEGSIGKRVQLRTNKGRKKSLISEGVVDSAYPGVFIVRVDDGLLTQRKLSYSYSDVLTETVELTFGPNIM